MTDHISSLANKLHNALNGIKKKEKLQAVWLTRAEIADQFGVSKDAVDAYAKKHSLKFKFTLIKYPGTGSIRTKLHYLPQFSDWSPMRYCNSVHWRHKAEQEKKKT